MSYDNMNISGRNAGITGCAPGMPLPSFAQASYQPPQMPAYQQQIGITGGAGCSSYAPPTAISYSPHYVGYHGGHQSYNSTLGTLANIVIGAIYSTPMGGNSGPGQLAAQGGSNPYAAYCPPGQDPNQYYQQQYLLNQQYEGGSPQFIPMASNAGRCGYQQCNIFAPSGYKAYESMFSTHGVQNIENVKPINCEEWEADVSGGKGTLKLSDRYEIKLNATNGEFEVYDKCNGKKSKIWGALETDPNGNLVFKETTTLILEDGTKITVRMVKDKDGKAYPSELYITKGDKAMIVKGLGPDSVKDGDLRVSTNLTSGKATDLMIDDGAVTIYQLGEIWVNGATKKQITQNQINNAEALYDEDEHDDNIIIGTKKDDDSLKGDGNDNRYIATEGRDYFNGYAGTDTAVFEGDMEDYKITKLANGTIFVLDDDGNKTFLTNVEIIEFNDQKYTINSSNDTNDWGKGQEDSQIVFGGEGNDVYTLDEDVDPIYFDGGAGSDIMSLKGKRSDYEFEEGLSNTTIIRNKNGDVVAVVRDVEIVRIGDDFYDLKMLVDGTTDGLLKSTTINGNDSIESKNISEIAASFNDTINTVIYDAKGGVDGINITSIIGTGEYTASYANNELTLTKSDGKRIIIRNVENLFTIGTSPTIFNISKLDDTILKDLNDSLKKATT